MGATVAHYKLELEDSMFLQAYDQGMTSNSQVMERKQLAEVPVFVCLCDLKQPASLMLPLIFFLSPCRFLTIFQLFLCALLQLTVSLF